MTGQAGRKTIQKIIELEEVDSTNRYALDSGTESLLVVAHRQTAGRGRRGRTWYSPEGTNLYMSLTVGGRPDSRYTIVAGVAVREALASLAGPQSGISIKWPNDILAAGKKICGILCEARGKLSAIGVGINVNQDSWPDEHLAHKATSLYQSTGKFFDRREVQDSVVRELDKWLTIYKQDGFDRVRSNFLENSSTIGTRVVAEDKTEGLAADISEDGCLIVQTSDGMRTIINGDIRRPEGYPGD